ncbi:hypothetical protein OG592_43805 (plasmid) [Streptomyces avidinii]|uniref:hypothetical protein n=1 Tax=Streptomyces avidinii TaxID=1895 RepID=UPI002F91364A|nr:hypothetical protein OG592_43805 [Streptomyces avidinii]
MTTKFPAGTGRQLLDADEARVARASLELTTIAAALVSRPMDRDLHAQMRAFLDSESEPALTSWDALLARTQAQLKERISTVLTVQALRTAS